MNEFLFASANVIGVTGVILILIAYTLLQLERLAATTVLYSLLNVIGSILILFSLYYYWNLASGVIEVAWLAISCYGLTKAVIAKVRHKREAAVKNIH